MTGAAGTRYELALWAQGRWVRGVITGVGAAIRHLSIGGVALTPDIDDRAPAPFFCGKVLVPWPNRVRDGRWTHGARTLQLDITDPVHGTALHGLLCTAAYRPVTRGPSSITLSAPILPQDGYPFHLDTEVHYRLAADGLVTTHCVRNVGPDCAPVAVGAHPFLAIGDVPTDKLTLTVDGVHHIDVDDRLIPSGATAVEGTDWDLRAGRTVTDIDLDDSWSVPRERAGGTVHSLRAPDGRTVSLWADANFGFVHVFITREFPTADGFVTAVALEPMTAQPDALNSGIGLRWLRAGETLCASWAIRYDDGCRREDS
ncbi:aldose 1-epimerase family protein [Mycolicibacterium baixiangningiae]|uniref:aldose 1-epimerase family protein n=1 Tax=Mycolicibacterium baixiangningiae TaxID=2761578 RepID=UPI0018688EC1|nr:aldose 1-epimerase family protein [Mycolicibacterium baixiangningiae]